MSRNRWVVVATAPVAVLALVLIGAGIAGRWWEPARIAAGHGATSPSPSSSQTRADTPAPAPTSPANTRVSAPARTTAPPRTTARSATPRPFMGSILIRHPEFGWTLFQGQEVRGDVNGWVSGYQIWLSARMQGATDEVVQGPCAVSGTAFTCTGVQLPGAAGTHLHLRVAVVSNDMADELDDATVLAVSRVAAYDQTEIYKG